MKPLKCVNCEGIGYEDIYDDETESFIRQICSICGGKGTYIVPEDKNYIKEKKVESKSLGQYDQITRLVNNRFDELEQELKIRQRQVLDDYLLELFTKDKGIFLKQLRKYLAKYIDSEIRVRTRDSNFHKVVSEGIKNKINDIGLKEVISEAINRYVYKNEIRLRRELNVAKELCYSIESEIRHTVMKMPISASKEQIAMDKINEIVKINLKKLELSESPEKLQIEEKPTETPEPEQPSVKETPKTESRPESKMSGEEFEELMPDASRMLIKVRDKVRELVEENRMLKNKAR